MRSLSLFEAHAALPLFFSLLVPFGVGGVGALLGNPHEPFECLQWRIALVVLGLLAVLAGAMLLATDRLEPSRLAYRGHASQVHPSPSASLLHDADRPATHRYDAPLVVKASAVEGGPGLEGAASMPVMGKFVDDLGGLDADGNPFT